MRELMILVSAGELARWRAQGVPVNSANVRHRSADDPLRVCKRLRVASGRAGFQRVIGRKPSRNRSS